MIIFYYQSQNMLEVGLSLSNQLHLQVQKGTIHISTYHRCSVGGLMALTVSSKSILPVAWFAGFTKEPDWFTLDFRATYISHDSMLKSVFVLEMSYLV